MAYGTPRAVALKDANGEETFLCIRQCVERLVSLGLIKFVSQYDQQTRYHETFGVERAVAYQKLAGIERALLEGLSQDELDTSYCELCGKKLNIHCTDY